MGFDRPLGYRMQAWVDIGIYLLHDLRNGRAAPQYLQRAYYLLLALHTMSYVLAKFSLWIRNGGAMSRNYFCYIHLLQALERVEIVLHIALWWFNDYCAHSRHDITRKKCPLSH